MTLTAIQQKIVEARGRNVLVSAGAGSGKTRVLVERFVDLVRQGEALAGEILTLTFTDKAALEMKSRMMARFKAMNLEGPRRDLESAYISTFHAFASRLLKEHPLEGGVDPDFAVLEEEDAGMLQDQALDETFETLCTAGSQVFELLKRYEEPALREGILELYETARTSGFGLAAYFERCNQNPRPDEKVFAEVGTLLHEVKEPELAEAWHSFWKTSEWNWPLTEVFTEWRKSFSKKGNTGKLKPLWTQIKETADLFLALRIESLAAPWRETVQHIALDFEVRYQALKNQQAVLDFHDLELCMLQTFENPRPVNQMLRERYRKKFKFIMIDEFQDTSAVQARLVDLISGSGNVFYVGDYKQSIYGFRGTSPEFFLQKAGDYASGGQGVCIPLIENFRTCAPALDFINAFFSRLWEAEPVAYELLLAADGAAKEAPDSTGPAVEAVVIETQDDENAAQGRMREGASIAARIQNLRKEGYEYGDIVILFRAMTDSGIYEHALKTAGIPYFAVSGRGFYHQPEIKDVLSFLGHLDNPLEDVPLAAVLRSPLFQVSDDALWILARIAKKNHGDAPLYKGIEAVLQDGDPNGLAAHLSDQDRTNLKSFLDVSRVFSDIKSHITLAELIERILNTTGYAAMVLAGPQGTRRYANLKKLADLARSYESRDRMTLGDFIRRIRSLENREVRESEAQVQAEASREAVRLMTVHAAKGLEFPVVFAADMSRTVNASRASYVTASSQGWGLKVLNERTREYEQPWSFRDVASVKSLAEKRESMRLLYVAMTRAEKKLILSGVYKASKKEKESFIEMRSWLDWLVAMRKDVEAMCPFEWLTEELPVRHSAAAPAQKKKFQIFFDDFAAKPLEDLIPEEKTRAAACDTSEHIFSRMQKPEQKPSRVIDLPVTAYVQQAKKKRAVSDSLASVMEMREEDEPAAAFDEAGLPTAADTGTRMHLVLQHLDLKDPFRNLDYLIQESFRESRPDEIKEARDLLSRWIQSPCFKDVQKARRVYREIPFVLDERHGRIDGVIDLLYQSAGGDWTVLDYKTAEGDALKAEASGYTAQIYIYAYAVSRILKIIPKEGVVYFLKNNFAHTTVFSGDSLNKFGDSLRDMQEQMLIE